MTTHSPINDFIVIGAGGHAQVIAAAVLAQGARILAYSSTDQTPIGGLLAAIPRTDDEAILNHTDPDQVLLLMGIGAVTPCPDGHLRRSIVSKFAARGFHFATVTHPAAWIAPDCHLEQGAQVHAGAIIQPGCHIGAHAIINTKASIDHDSTIGAFVHLAPGVTVCGNCFIGSGCMLGTGANIIHGVSIGNSCLIAAGATVIADLPDNTRVKGTPAQPF